MQLGRGWRRLQRGNNVGNETFLARHILAHENGSLAHCFVRHKGTLDLAKLDAKATNLDLLVAASEKLHLAVRSVAPAVAELVETSTRFGAEWIGNVSFSGQHCVCISESETFAAGIDVAGNADRNRIESCIQDVIARILYRFSIEDAGPVWLDCFDHKKV